MAHKLATPDSPFSLKGRRAVITGGSRGIGGAVTRLLATAGADVCIGFHSRAKDANALAAQCTLLGVRATLHASDISTPAGARSLIAHAGAELGGLDICVHSAGIWTADDAPVSALADDRWANTMRQNVDAMFFIAREAARAMEKNPRMGGERRRGNERRAAGGELAGGRRRHIDQRRAARDERRGGNGDFKINPPGCRGRIVLIASTAGQRGEAMHADYAASKGAMIAFVKSMAVELAPAGITVNSVAPGWVDTEMCAQPFGHGGKERIVEGIPVGRIASADDIAFPVVSLCFDGARHVTGEIVNVNGGSVLCG
jgi:3-oxoacyl-[acyl-carrier protein] reductase